MHVPVEKVARVALEGIERDKALVIPGLAMKIAMAITRMVPLSLLRLASRFIEQDQAGPGPLRDTLRKTSDDVQA